MQNLIANIIGNRAFDRRTQTVVAVAMTVALTATLATAGQAQPKRAPHHTFQRSVWAVRWSQQHPAQAAAYQHSLRTRYTRPSYSRYAAKPRKTWRRYGAPKGQPIIAQQAPLSLVPAAPAVPVRIAATFPLPATLKILPSSPVVKAAAPIDRTQDVTLDFVGADINDVLKALALQTHSNIVSGTDVKGSVTVSLTHVTLEEALELITKLSGYLYAKVGRTYVIGSPASIATLTAGSTSTVPPATAVVTFSYSDPNALLTTIKDRYPNVKISAGRVNGTLGGGVLVITGPESDVEAAKQLVADAEGGLSRSVDSSHTEVYDIKYASADDLVSVLNRLIPNLIVTPAPSRNFTLTAPNTADSVTTSSQATFGAPPAGAAPGAAPDPSGGAQAATKVAVKATTHALLLTGSDSDIARAKTLIAQVDTQPKQITYEAKITEVQLTNEKDFGLGWDFSGASTTIGELGGALNGTSSPSAYPGNILKFGTIGRSALSNIATVKLDAKIKSGDVKLLSNPNIAAIDGEQAAVFIGDTVRYISSITQTSTGQTVTTDSVNIGIKLFVTGKVNNDGYVTLNIHPEVSTISGYLAVPGGGSLPQISNREATTTIRVKDGETIAIGGLIGETDIKNIQKVPILGDLPFFGQLFRDTQHTHNRNELVIFVKVGVQKETV
jgi:type II secretory pathway component GspD/PulD (secretin)